MTQAIKVLVGDWRALGEQAAALRHQVFVVEQGVPPEEELDEQDAACVHALAVDADGRAVGTGRLLPDGHIGRMAVLAASRRRGVGSLLLRALMGEARRKGCRAVALAAQLHAQPFYRAHGFQAKGGVFLDAGIEHILMRRDLGKGKE